MKAYEIYLRDEVGENLIGILPERRRNPVRITRQSIMNWVKYTFGANVDVSDIHLIEVEADRSELLV